MQLRDRVYPGLNRDKMTSRGVKALTNFSLIDEYARGIRLQSGHKVAAKFP